MRFIPVILMVLALTGCELFQQKSEVSAVDANSLPPLTSREQSLIYAADGAYHQGNYAAAERDYMTAVADSKGRVDAHLALARLYDKQQMPQKQREVLERAILLQPNQPLANYMLGKIHLNADDYTAALTAFQRGRITRPDDADLTIGQAVANDMLGAHRDAQRLYINLMRTNTGSSQGIVRTNLAMSYLLSNNPQNAVDLLKESATLPNASPVERQNLALAYGLLGRHTDAKTLLNGEIDEETRMLAVARMQAYQQEYALRKSPKPVVPSITDIAAPPETASPLPAPVIQHPTTATEAEKIVQPITTEPAGIKDATSTIEPDIEPAAPKINEEDHNNTETEEGTISPDDPNYIPGLVDDSSYNE